MTRPDLAGHFPAFRIIRQPAKYDRIICFNSVVILALVACRFRICRKGDQNWRRHTILGRERVHVTIGKFGSACLCQIR